MSVLPVGIGADSAAGSYQIERSLRFNSADSAYLSRTPGSAGNRKTWTWSGWVKYTNIGAGLVLLNAGTDNNNRIYVNLQTNDTLTIGNASGGVFTNFRVTTQVFRDPSAWYHFVIALDTTQATGSNRVRLYVNGNQITTFSASNDPTQNADFGVNNTVLHTIQANTGLTSFLNGYLTEINFIDGSALDPTSFGEFNSDTGVWQPKAYTGSYGTNGFYLNFSDNSGVTSTTLGADSSGNGNNWTPNNFSVTAGAGNDSLVDTPTSYGTDTGAGGEVRGNYCTLNPLVKSFYAVTPANGNLESNSNASGWTEVHGTIGVQSGKWYWEVKPYDAFNIVGVNSLTYVTGQSDPHTRTGALAWYGSTGAVYVNGSSTATNLGTFNGTNTIGIALDMDAGTVQFYKDGVAAGSAQSLSSSIGSNLAFPCMFTSGTAATYSIWNYGQRPFAYTAPSGFKALCTQNLPEPTIVDGGQYFNTVLYTGNGTGQSITGVGFQPDWVWFKRRSLAENHWLTDVVRGSTKGLFSNLTDAEATRTDQLTSFDADGFSLGADTAGYTNASGRTYAAWNWKANGSGVSNTDGTITSTVSVNTDSGFSIVTYTGTGANATVGHGLGVAPRMVIVKARNAVEHWPVYHASLGAGGQVYLSLTDGYAAATTRWNNTAPTSSVFSVGTTGNTNGNGVTFVAYCFAAIPGYSAFGSYTGNGSADGVFVYTGMRPRWVMVKRTDTTQNWFVWDTERETYNVMGDYLLPNSSAAEPTGEVILDMLSNGFKMRSVAAGVNASGGTYIYMAFAESPFKYSLGR